VTKPTYDHDFWEHLWSKTLSERSDHITPRPPNRHLVAEVKHLRPGRALDAGCGHGSDTLWLATHGWQVTAVDFSETALAHGRSRAQAAGEDIAERIHC
jgi:2-polyprenyl-3-methyl-5-hydroxy-6-metoxy-1,4-benzoquinol methylase